MGSTVAEFMRKQVPDWDDEIVATARFKAFSGQRSDWEARFQFWRDLIIKVARHLGQIIIDTEEVKNKWFVRGGLTPLCMNDVLLEMDRSGDLLSNQDFTDQAPARYLWWFQQVASWIGISMAPVQDMVEGKLVVTVLVKELADQVTSSLAQSHWSHHCVTTMEKFQSLCGGFEEAKVVMSYFVDCGRARHLLINKDNCIEGVKLSLIPVPVVNVSQLDYNTLHLHWTLESLQKQLAVIDSRCKKSKTLALSAIEAGNKQVALRHLRYLKLASESKAKCTGFMDRVEEILGMISDAESAKKVGEAIQVGARSIKEINICVEEVHACLQDLDESIALQKQMEDTLGAKPISSAYVEDEDLEEELENLEMELEDEDLLSKLHASLGKVIASEGKIPPSDSVEQTKSQEVAESVCQALSKLELEPA